MTQLPSRTSLSLNRFAGPRICRTTLPAQQTMQKLKALGRQRPAGGLLGSELEELARQATKKTLLAPDEELIQQVHLLQSCTQSLNMPREASHHQSDWHPKLSRSLSAPPMRIQPLCECLMTCAVAYCLPRTNHGDIRPLLKQAACDASHCSSWPLPLLQVTDAINTTASDASCPTVRPVPPSAFTCCHRR